MRGGYEGASARRRVEFDSFRFILLAANYKRDRLRRNRARFLATIVPIVQTEIP